MLSLLNVSSHSESSSSASEESISQLSDVPLLLSLSVQNINRRPPHQRLTEVYLFPNPNLQNRKSYHNS
jgi:hypothetical protein